jgi:hypothetical protein
VAWPPACKACLYVAWLLVLHYMSACFQFAFTCYTSLSETCSSLVVPL